jgi:hypothetical protein
MTGKTAKEESAGAKDAATESTAAEPALDQPKPGPAKVRRPQKNKLGPFLAQVSKITGSLIDKTADGDAAFESAKDARIVTQGTPKDLVRRGQATEILARAVPSIPRAPKRDRKLAYFDVPLNAWYGRSAHVARQTGILGGRADNTFAPTDVITQGDVRKATKAAESPKTLTREQQMVGMAPALAEQLKGQEEGPEGPDSEGRSYAHGGFLGAANEMIHDLRWMGILRELYPSVERKVMDELQSAVDKAQAKRDRKEFSRPLLLQMVAGRSNEPLDVDFEPALTASMALLENNPVLAAYGLIKEGWKPGKADWGNARPLEWDVWLDKDNPGHTNAARIAHGNKAELFEVSPAIGGYVDPANVMGGLSTAEWLENFGRAMHAADSSLDSLQDLHSVPPDQAAGLALEYMGTVGVYLDIKQAEDGYAVHQFVTSLKGHGVRVRGVGAFDPELILGLDNNAETDEIEQVVFFHTTDGMLDWLKDSGELAAGQANFRGLFNAASMIDKKGNVRSKKVKKVRERLQAVKDKTGTWLSIGFYTQETDITPEQLRGLRSLATDHDDLFTAGFADGNLEGLEADYLKDGKGDGDQKYVQGLIDAGEVVEAGADAMRQANAPLWR